MQVASWYGTAWKYRWPIAVDVSTAGATSDVEITIPPSFDLFWNNVDSAGDDVRVTDAHGTTLVTFDLASFNTTNRTGTIEIDNLSTTLGSAAGASTMLLWLYWGNAAASTALTTFAPSSPISGYICLEAPMPGLTVVAKHESYGSDYPSQRINVYNGGNFTMAVYTEVWVDLSPALLTRTRPYNNWYGNSGPSATRLRIAVQGTKTEVNASTYSETRYRYGYGADGRLYAKFVLLSDSYLSEGSTYTATAFVYPSHDTTAVYGYSFEIYVTDLL